MRRLLLLFILTLSFIMAWTQTWDEVADFNPSQTLQCIKFASPEVGYTVSTTYNGVTLNIHKTEDGGDTWIDQNSTFTGHKFNDIWPLTEDRVFICGVKGLLLSTENGGVTWENQVLNENIQYATMYFVDERGWVAGDQGNIYRTDDFGETWEELPNNLSYAVTDIYFLDRENGFAGGLNFFKKTTDGGSTWEDMPDLPTPNINYWIREFEFLSRDIGYICGDIGHIYRTLDGGVTWTYMETSIEESLQAMHSFEDSRIYAGGYAGTIIKSENAGLDWELMETTTEDNFYGMDFSDVKTGFVCSWSGSVYRIIEEDITSVINYKQDILTLFPNPCTEVITISELSEDCIAYVFSSDGKLLLTQSLVKGANLSVATDQLASGNYFLNLISQDRILVSRKFQVLKD